jgi:predicted molibdopterin-dependent oxidoreductase YjgC
MGRISWREALDTVASRLSEIKEQHAAAAVVFGRATPSGGVPPISSPG